MVDTTTAGNLSYMQQLIDSFVGMLDGEAAIPSVDRQLSADNITEINVLVADLLTQMDDIINAA